MEETKKDQWQKGYDARKAGVIPGPQTPVENQGYRAAMHTRPQKNPYEG